MESPSSPILGSTSTQPSRSRSSTKLVDSDVKSLTSFNPFSEEDEHDQTSYTLVSSLFSRMRNTLAAPLASAVAVSSNAASPNNAASSSTVTDARRPSSSTIPSGASNSTTRTSGPDRPNPLFTAPASTAPPLMSLTPAQSELPTYAAELDTPSHRQYPVGVDGPEYGTSIPGFPIPDDARSIKTSTSLHRTSNSVSKVMRRLRGEGLSRDYWMDDENCRECYDCKSVFTAWRRKHHCRICGQIFCSRCASNIIKGARFGAEGMIRTCNFCLERKGEEDDDDDRRSIISSSTTFPAHQLGLDSFRQSPFTASPFFGKADEPFNLYSITETRRPFFGTEEGFSRPETPSQNREGSIGLWDSVRVNPAPFRRTLLDEEKDPSVPPSALYNSESSPGASDAMNKIEFPTTKPVSIDTSTSYIQFPIGSPDNLASPTRMLNKSRAPNTPYGDFEVATPFIRSRVQSKLDPTFEAEPGWRTRRESTAYAQELNLASMLHLKIMLRQMLTLENIPNIREWEETLLGLALRIAREMTFTASPHRQGQDMDVRRYVKIKKIPGGTPKDSEYVAGVVITKNVAHKQMSRLQVNPRVMLVTFPLEFSRVEGQYMHFGQIVRQEKEYLGNLASRIAALRPHVVLVEKSVSRLALDALAKHNIAVARGLKPSAIQTIARMTQGDVFSSMDKLALEPRLGHCSRYCIQTYDHPLIPGRRKTYMRFEGCSRDLGCTLVLRGGDPDTLRRIKKVTRFLTFVVRNLKLETHLWKDSVISLPSFNPLAVPPSLCQQFGVLTAPLAISVSFSASRLFGPDTKDPEAAPTQDGDGHEDLSNEEADQLRLTRRIEVSLEPYLKTFISVSATLRFHPPYPIRRMKELDNMLLQAKRAWEDEIVWREEHTQSMHKREETITPRTVPDSSPSPGSTQTNERDEIVAQIDALLVNNVFPLPLTDGLPSPNASDDGSSYFTLGQGPHRVTPLNVLSPPTEPESLKTSGDVYHQSHYTLLKWEHDEFRRIWEWYLRKNSDDFVVEKYQCLHLRECTVLGPDFLNQQPCIPPRLRYIKFYGENDMTLGQFIEKSINEYIVQYLDPKAVCTGKGCEQPLFRHGKVFTHNETKLFVAVEKWEGHIVGLTGFYPAPDLVTTWGACRVCGSATPFILVSEEMQRYSFAKFLELHFYPADVLLVQGAGCQHNIYEHHVRYFAFKGMTLRFQTEPIQCHEFIFPPFRIRVRPEAQLEIKNAEFERLFYRNLLWYTGLIDDLKLISIEAATGDEDADALLLADINALIARAELEREDISRLINQIYRESAPTDTLALNQVHAYRQDKIVGWQQDFDRLPKPRPLQLPTNRDSKRTSAFGSVRQMWPRRYDLLDTRHLPSASVSETEETHAKAGRIPTGDSLTSSEASEPETGPDYGTNEIKKKDENLPEHADSSVKVGTPEATTSEDQLTSAGQPRSDPDSDSTIGAVRDDVLREESMPASSVEIARNVPRKSRLPRGTAHNMTVAELVKKYQDYLPAQGVHDLAHTALSPRPVVSESEQEYPPHIILRSGMGRTRTRHRLPPRKPSTSDFEQGYAANVAPRYVSRRKSGNHSNVSRIPAPIAVAPESHESSRLPSPEKRPYVSRDSHLSRPSSPYADRPVPPSLKSTKQRFGISRSRDKPSSRVPTTPGKATFRRPATSTGNKVSTIARHFERLGREAERSRSRYAVIRSKPARPVVFARAKVEVLDSVKDAIADDSESSDPSSEADDEDEGNDEEHRAPPVLQDQQEQPGSSGVTPLQPQNNVLEVLLSPPHVSSTPEAQDNKDVTRLAPPGQISLPPSPFLKAVKAKHDSPLTPPTSEIDSTERNSILKALSGFWQQPARSSIEVDDPMNDPEHIFRDSSMVVRLDEPTSIIALALNSPQYRDMLAKSRAEKRTAREAKLEGGEVFMPDDRSMAESTSTWGVVNIDSVDSADPTEDLRVPSSKLPWAITIESDGLTISCTVLYPERFDALRRTYDCEKSMVESLSRCLKWNASGGKSGSAFLKTRDDRFIAKELSKAELQAMETFAPAYFDYMSSSVHSNRPTLLAKVFGCYKVTFKKMGKDKAPGKSKSTQMNLLVMENLFYDRRFSRIYDLKGSTRNRHVQSTGRENEVLLDENLVETANRKPYYIREHSKRILRGALCSDSKFLADINVMDYSLVCGVDSTKNELVIGIVDYIRTYTWDKKLESWVKDLGGAGRGEPTIVTPRQYRQRFLSAMERYFSLVPDRWMKQADALEEDPILRDHWPDW